MSAAGARRSEDAPRGEDGWVLVEALVAAAIVAMILGGVYQVVADSLVRHRLVEARRYALLVARSRLAAAGSEVPLQGGAVDGVEGGYAWRTEMQPCADGPSAAGVLYCVTVAVRGPGGGPPLVVLDTRRLGPPA